MRYGHTHPWHCHRETGHQIVPPLPQVRERVPRVLHFFRSGIGTIDLVYKHHRFNSQLGLFVVQTCLGLWSLIGIHHQHHPVHHLHHPLDLTTKISMPGSIYNIYQILSPADRCVLRLNSNSAPFPGPESMARSSRAWPKGTGLPEQLVHKGGLAMINVSADDRQVTNAVWSKRIHEIKVRETIDRLLLLQDLLSQKKILKEIFPLEKFLYKTTDY